MRAPLCYCGNVHAASDLKELLHSLATGPALVREKLGASRLAYGLWLSENALRESGAEDHQRLQEALSEHSLDVWTLNGFPVGNFHAPVVKYDVYQPSWLHDARLDYTLQAAALLARLLPDHTLGTISTLPVGYRSDFTSSDAIDRAARQLCRAALGLRDLQEQTGKRVRLCLEPEPGCVLESGQDAADFFAGPLARAGHQLRAQSAVAQHLGLCLDTCHHAVIFEEPAGLLSTVQSAGIAIGKVQVSSAVHMDPRWPGAMSDLRALDEPRFLHQVRARHETGKVWGCDDLGEIESLADAEAWRVHYHLPIHHRRYGALETTQPFMLEILELLPGIAPDAHYEVETYTWGVLPAGLRPTNAAQLAGCIADELRFAEEHLP